MDIAISDDTYQKYLQKNDVINNSRLRPENENFFDAMMTVDLNATPERREILKIIQELE
jgi:hypothetical protein